MKPTAAQIKVWLQVAEKLSGGFERALTHAYESGHAAGHAAGAAQQRETDAAICDLVANHLHLDQWESMKTAALVGVECAKAIRAGQIRL